ncbi:MAG TPA: helix-turn-helix domain-containing protein [Myxococcota bacterium]|nr:helix-turn-helix domain-containing protein [Myxococcota bacterium]
MGLREEHRRDKEQRILAAAESLFHERGFAATTTREIAQRAEIATGTLFLYAKTKEDLLLLIWRDRIEAVVERAFATLPRAPLPQQVASIFGSFLDFYAQDQALARVYVRELLFPGSEAESASYTFVFLQRLQALLEEAEVRGELQSDLPLPLLAANLFGSYVMLLIGWLNGSVPEDQLHPLLLASLELQLQALAPHGAAR